MKCGIALKSTSVTTIMLVLASVAAGLDLSNGRWIDLTHEFSEQTIYWPTAEPFEKSTVFQGITERGYYYSAYNYQAAEHGGTHLDAPIHFYQGRNTVEQIPIDQFVGNAAVIDVSAKARTNRDYQVSVKDVLAWETKNGRLPPDSILLISTGFDLFWPDKESYMGTDKRGDEAVKYLSFPGIHPQTAEFLANERKIKAVGLDTPSIDYGKSKDFRTHRILFEKNIIAFENVANLDKLPATGATVVALPMKIKGGSGAPLRIIAFVPQR